MISHLHFYYVIFGAPGAQSGISEHSFYTGHNLHKFLLRTQNDKSTPHLALHAYAVSSYVSSSCCHGAHNHTEASFPHLQWCDDRSCRETAHMRFNFMETLSLALTLFYDPHSSVQPCFLNSHDPPAANLVICLVLAPL
jgi:hypothetical protein